MNRSTFGRAARCVPLATIAATVLPVVLGAQAQRAAAPRDPFAGFDRYATEAMTQWKVPGMAIAVVRGDSVLLAKGYGVRTFGDPTPVDARTVFAIGSASKAFTGAALAMLADEGKLSFDGRVTDYLPSFQMSDPWVTREMRVRDLLLHRSGAGGGNVVFYGSTRSREEIVRAIRHLAPTSGFRTRFEYQNLMYVAAGEVARQVSGRSWDDFVKERIFAPLGMRESNTSVRDLAGLPNVATPHAELGGAVRSIPWRNIDNAAAAGSINSTVLDVARWLRLWVNGGMFEGKRLLSESVVREAITPQFVVDDPDLIARFISSRPPGYGFGWFVSELRGRLWVLHGGNIDGMAAMVSFLPDERVGVVILTNMNQSDITIPLSANLYDRLLDIGPPRDYDTEYRAARQAYDAKRRAAGKAPTRVTGTRPSLPLASYAGVYRNELLGTATVTLGPSGALSIRYDQVPSAEGELTHWHFDSFVAALRDPMLGRVPVSFRLGSDGRIAALVFGLGGSVEWLRQ